MIRYISILTLRVLNLSVEYEYEQGVFEAINKRAKGKLFVANHLSYLDIMVLAKTHPLRFVSSVDFAQSGIAGFILTSSGSILVERKHYIRKLKGDVEAIRQALHQGFDVGLFPEGTSTDGKQMLPFKSSLFEAAIKNKSVIIPICISYTISGNNINKDIIHDEVYFHSDSSIFPHFINLCKYSTIKAKVKMMQPVLEQDRKRATQKCNQIIKSEFFSIDEDKS